MKILRHQWLHLLALILLLAAFDMLMQWPGSTRGGYLGLSTREWFVIALAVPIAHQIYVALCWRAELHYRGLSRVFGGRAFTLFGVVFFILFVSRLLSIILLAVSNQASLRADPILLTAVSALIAVPAVYTFHSVYRYFSFRRALGIDHFDPGYRDAPLVREGIFRFTPNAMYIFGLAVLWLPGLMLASKAALLAALFNHLYIWVHYYTVERPDMRLIYGRGA